MTVTKYCFFLFSLFFLLNVVGPTLVLLNSNDALLTIVLPLENESEKDIEDLKDLDEFDFNKAPFNNVNPILIRQALSFVFFNNSLGEIHLENTSPPPEVV